MDENLHDLLNMKYVIFRFGRIPAAYYDDCLELVKARDDVYFIRTGEDTENGFVYGAYFVLPHSVEQVDSIFGAQHFTRIQLAKNLTGTADETKLDLMNGIESDTKRISELEQERRELVAAEREDFLSHYSYVRFMSECCSLRSLAGYHNGSFYLVGWIPKSDEESFARELEEFAGIVSEETGAEADGRMLLVRAPTTGGLPVVISEKPSSGELSCVLSDGDNAAGIKPPVRLRSGFLSRIYAPFVEMYGLPAYNEADPRLFMAITYTLLFGIMYGDIGQGVVLCLFGLLLWRWKKMWLGRILALCGVSSAIFGAVYGSVFGFEDWLPGYKVLEGGNTMRILIAAVALGVVLLMVCMVINIVNGIRQKDWGKVLFSPNGLAGMLLYLSIAAGVAVRFAFGVNLFIAPYILGLIVLPLLCILGQEPLGRLVSGVRPWLPESIGIFFVEGFFELFETMLTYVSNTISFLRVGAFAISHAGMMMVVMLLTSDGKSIPGVILGNILVMCIEGMLVCIQVLRLEFYEMFGRFYTGGGQKFSPKVIDYTAKA